MTNEIQINVAMSDGTGPGKDEIKARLKEFGASLPPIEVKASNPIDAAYVAEVRAQIDSLEAESFEIPITADTEEARAEVAAAIEELQTKAAIEVAMQAGNVEEFNAEVLGDIEALRVRIGALVVPVEADTTRQAQVSQPAVGQFYTTNAVSSEAQSAYQAMAREATANPVTLPVRAANPIDDAWLAQVKSSLRVVANDALSIPVNPELADFEAQLEATLAQLATTSKLDVPVDVGDAMIFREQVQELVQQVENSVKAVIDVQVNNEGALTDLQQKTVAASQADLELVQAQQKLNEATASGNDEAIAKARNDVVAADKAASAATEELTAAQAAVAETETVVADATNKTAFSMRGLMESMGPLWMVINVAQMAMFAFGGTSSTTAKQTQDLSSQIISLGQAAGQAGTSLEMGNQNLQRIGTGLSAAGSSAAAFSQAFDGGVASAQRYTDALVGQQKALGDQHTLITQTVTDSESGNSATATQSYSVKELTEAVNSHALALSDLSGPQQQMVADYNAFNDVIPQAKNALDAMKASAQAEQAVLASLGYTMSDGQRQAEAYGLGVQAAAKALTDAEAGATYLEDSTDKASIAAGQGVQQWKQLQTAVTSAQTAYQQAAAGVASAEHGVETAQQGVASAIHAEEQAVIAVRTAQTAYTNSLYQEGQAQAAVTAARAAAEQQLISLKLQANDAAASVDNANLSLYNAQQNAGKYGVNSGNAQQIADTQNITAANAAQVQAAIQLVQAENALADAQNSSSTAQSGLNTARQQGVDGNPQVLAAEHALQQAQDAVTSAAQGVTNAQYAQKQAAEQVSNAEWSLQAASAAVGQAENAEATAATALTTARDNATRSTDQNTLAGAQNRTMLANLFDAYQKETGNEQTAAQMTQTVGEKMGFTSQQIGDVIGSLTGLDGQSAQFFVTGTPSLNPQQLVQVGNELGLNFSQIESVLPKRGGHGAYAAGGPTGSGIALVGEQGPEFVHLAPGSTVMPNANTMNMLKGYAAGGSVGALDNPMAALMANVPMVGQWAGLDAVGQALHAMGGPAVHLPAAGSIDLGPFGFSGGGGNGAPAVSGSAAQAQAYAFSQLARHGWGPDQMTPLIKLWNQECLPLRTRILTRRGWLNHDEVVIGDETIGYNPRSGRSEWTRVTKVHHYTSAETVRFGNKRWSVECTPNHRWWMEEVGREWPDGTRRSGRGGYVPGSVEVVRGEGLVETRHRRAKHRVVLARRAHTEGDLPITTQEAGLLGWIAGDGTLNSDGGFAIYQAKQRYFSAIDFACHADPKWHQRRRKSIRRGHDRQLPCTTWSLSREYSRDLLRRAGNPKVDAVAQVLRMSTEQRAAWLDAIIGAEGSAADDKLSIYQNDGPVADAIEIAVYLSGSRPSRVKDTRGEKVAWCISVAVPHVGGPSRNSFTEPGPTQPVWCVTTELGSWTADQDGQVFLTGNSGWNPYAVNPSSGAYGIPQSLGHGHPYNLGDYVGQVDWGEDYIAGRYGSPARAWAHEVANNWYAGGGSAGGGLAVVGEHGAELVSAGGGTITNAAPAAPGVLRLEIGSGADGAFASAFKNLVRGGQIRITLNGTQVVVS